MPCVYSLQNIARFLRVVLVALEQIKKKLLLLVAFGLLVASAPSVCSLS